MMEKLGEQVNPERGKGGEFEVESTWERWNKGKR
jgi:hypothetical protein